MINKFISAKENGMQDVVLFGDGTPTREFLYVDDLADACIFLMNNYDSPDHINIGSSEEYTIAELAAIVAKATGFTGNIIWDTSKPNGTPRRKLDNSKMEQLGWKSKTTLSEGLFNTVNWFIKTGGKRNG
jgi:GDP-L-fucose synthase